MRIARAFFRLARRPSPRWLSDVRGAAAIEYALVAVFISLAAIVALELAGISLSNVFSSVADSLPAGS